MQSECSGMFSSDPDNMEIECTEIAGGDSPQKNERSEGGCVSGSAANCVVVV